MIGEPHDQITKVLPGGKWPPFEGPLDHPPSTRTEIYKIFGDPGTVAKPNKAWQKQSLVTVRDLPGVPSRWYFTCHRLVEPYLREGLRRATISSPGYKILRAGSFNLRHIQFNAARPLSLHSWGIAVDFDEDRNNLRNFARGACPTPWSDAWMKLYPNGVTREFVEALESVGFTWGGVWGKRGEDFDKRSRIVSVCDPMHFEFRVQP